MLTHRQLRYFVEIVDSGSFSQAAERLFIAQSALSRQVREMEQALDVRLLIRDSRPLGLTAAGRSLYADARRILADLDAAARRATQAQRGLEGSLQLLHSSSVPLTPAWLSWLATRVRQVPGVTIEIALASSELQALEIVEGRADVGLARAPVLRRYPDVHYFALHDEPLLVAVAASHRLAGHPAIRLADLRDEAFVATPHLERGGLSHRIAELCRQAGFIPRPGPVRSRKWTQLSLVQGGLGIAIVPESMGRLAPVGVTLLPIIEPLSRSAVLLLAHVDPPPHVADFVAALKALSLDDAQV